MRSSTEIKKETVVGKVISLIALAEEKIIMTMDSEEELMRPLPTEYHRTLAGISRRGIEITRFTYGSKKSFEEIRKKHKYATTIYGGEVAKYQRMIVVDGKKAMFHKKGKFYFTRSKPVIKSLLDCVRIYSL